jgi:hypothetical protein
LSTCACPPSALRDFVSVELVDGHGEWHCHIRRRSDGRWSRSNPGTLDHRPMSPVRPAYWPQAAGHKPISHIQHNMLAPYCPGSLRITHAYLELSTFCQLGIFDALLFWPGVLGATPWNAAGQRAGQGTGQGLRGDLALRSVASLSRHRVFDGIAHRVGPGRPHAMG